MKSNIIFSLAIPPLSTLSDEIKFLLVCHFSHFISLRHTSQITCHVSRGDLLNKEQGLLRLVFSLKCIELH